MSEDQQQGVIEFTPEELEQLKHLAVLYIDAKALILFSEEFDPDSRSNLQTIKELRDAFDHTMRVIGHKHSGIETDHDDDNDYCKKNLHKAVGHVYRAAFDALDGTVLSLRQKIAELINGYDRETLVSVFPDYAQMRLKLEELTKNISEHRARKDVGKDVGVTFDRYVDDVDQLKEFYLKILAAGNLLDEAKSEKSTRHSNQLLVNALFAIVSGSAAGLVVWAITN